MHEVMDARSMPFFFHSLCSGSWKRASFLLQQLSLFAASVSVHKHDRDGRHVSFAPPQPLSTVLPGSHDLSDAWQNFKLMATHSRDSTLFRSLRTARSEEKATLISLTKKLVFYPP